jgi:hypothetical protein
MRRSDYPLWLALLLSLDACRILDSASAIFGAVFEFQICVELFSPSR